MMRPDVRFERLNPVHVRRLVDTANLAVRPGPTLWVLHDSGRVLRAWHETRGAVPLAGPVSGTLEEAARWSVEYGAPEVRVADLAARDRFLAWAQDPAWVFAHDGFGHFEALHDGMHREGSGILCYPRREGIDRYVPVKRAREFLSRLRPDSIFLLGVVEGRAWWASLAVQLEGGEVVRVSTFDDLPEPLRKGPSGEEPGKFLAREAARHFRRPVEVLLLGREAFEDLARRHFRGLGSLERASEAGPAAGGIPAS